MHRNRLQQNICMLFAADEWAPHLRLCCVRCCVHVINACRACHTCRAVLNRYALLIFPVPTWMGD